MQRTRETFFEGYRRDRLDSIPVDAFAAALQAGDSRLAVSYISASLDRLEEQLTMLVNDRQLSRIDGNRALTTLAHTQGQLRAFKTALEDLTIYYQP